MKNGGNHMSKENVKLFYEALPENRSLQEKFKKANEKYAGQKIDKEAINLILQNELLPIAKEAGFDFTLDEFKEYAQENNQSAAGRLSDDELAAVAGGVGACVVGGGSEGGCSCVICGYGDNGIDAGMCIAAGAFVNRH
jgi:predicted ribosomally synthesized peptide with nif11-like leader